MSRFSAIILALVWFALRMTLHYTSWFEEELTISVMINLFFLVLIIYKSIREAYRPELPFIEVAKAGMRQASLYAFLVAILILVFYQFVDRDFISEGVDKVQAARMENSGGEAGWEKFKAENPSVEEETMDEFFKNEKEKIVDMFSPWFIASTSLFIMVLGGLIYSFIAAAFHRRMMKSLRR